LPPARPWRLPLSLEEGGVSLPRPANLPYAVDFRVAAGAAAARWDFPLSRRPGDDLPSTLHDGSQLFALTNDAPMEMPGADRAGGPAG